MITTPLEFNTSCKKTFALKEILSLTENRANAIVDSGNGDCNTLVKVTKDEATTEIDLKK